MAEDVNILEVLDEVQQNGLAALATVSDEAGLQAWRTAHLGRSAQVMLAFTRLGQISKEMRPAVGQKANQVKLTLEAALEERAEMVKTASLRQKLDTERLGAPRHGRRPARGRLPPAARGGTAPGQGDIQP